MNREIKFRGKDLKTGEWTYGSLITCEQYASIASTDEDGMIYNIAPDTVGQYTGLKGRNGTDIYEGDIVRFGSLKNVVEFRHGAFGYLAYDTLISYCGNPNFHFNPHDSDDRFEVLGNIHDNPQLLNQ